MDLVLNYSFIWKKNRKKLFETTIKNKTALSTRKVSFPTIPTCRNYRYGCLVTIIKPVINDNFTCHRATLENAGNCWAPRKQTDLRPFYGEKMGGEIARTGQKATTKAVELRIQWNRNSTRRLRFFLWDRNTKQRKRNASASLLLTAEIAWEKVCKVASSCTLT